MNEDRLVILEYDKPYPEKTKIIMNRALKIVFEGCDIEWINSRTIRITKSKLKDIVIQNKKVN